MIEKLAKAIKRSNKKKNVNVTLGLIIGFLLSSGTIYGDTTDGKDIFIKESEEYNKDTTLEHEGGQLISTGYGAPSSSITLDAGEHNLTLIHKANTPYIIKDLVGIENVKSLYSSVIADRGDLTIKAKKIALNSEIFVEDISPIDDISIESSSLSSGITVIGGKNKDGKVVLEAEEINIDVKGNGTLSGITLYEEYLASSFNVKAEIEAKDFKLNVKSKGIATGIEAIRGIMDIVSENIEIVTNSEKDINKENGIGAVGIEVKGGKVNIEAKNLSIETFSAKDTAVAEAATIRTYGIFNWDGISEIKIKSQNININSKSEATNIGEDGIVEAIGILNGSDRDSDKETMNIESENLAITTECTNGIAASISTESYGKTIINSKNIVLNTKGKSVYVEGFPVFKTIGISTIDHGITEINGGLEMYQIGKKEDILSIRAAAKEIVTINKNNENVAVKINDKMLADGGTINLNLNGANSYFRGQASIDEDLLESKINLGISNEAVWKNEGDSKVTNLTFNNGIIDMRVENRQ